MQHIYIYWCMGLQIHPGNRRAKACSVSTFGNSSKPGTSSSGARCCTVYVLHMCSKNFLYFCCGVWHIYLFTCSVPSPNNPTTPASGGCTTRAAKWRNGSKRRGAIYFLRAKSRCVPDILHLECLGTYAVYIHIYIYIYILVHGFADSSRKPESQCLFSQHLWKQLQAWNLLLRS